MGFGKQCLGAAAALILGACAQAQAPSFETAATREAPQIREIALSFDDAPMPDSHLMTGAQRTVRLISALERAEVEGAMIFAVGQGAATQEGESRLRAYARAGHAIANHSNTHRSANQIPADEFIADVTVADATLRRLPGFSPFFRYPYLDAGNTIANRDALRAGISALGYRKGYITIDTWDWYMAGEIDAALGRGQSVDWAAACAVYTDVMVRQANYFDGIAVRWLGRSPRHVVLLHENDLAALCIEDAVAGLRADGWRIISAEAAFADPIGAREPDTLELNSGQVVALAHLAGAPSAETHAGLNNEADLDALLARVIGPAAE